MTDTQHFVVSIDEGSSQGVYCAYCGEKIIPNRDDSGAYIFQCHCPDAVRERRLYEEKQHVEQDLEKFLTEKTDTMQINECRTRIVVYEQHTHELKKKLQELMNKVSGTTSYPTPGVSMLVVPADNFKNTELTLLEQEEEDHIIELTDEDEVPLEDVPIEEEITLPSMDEFETPEFPEEYPEVEVVECHDVPMASAESSSFDLDEEDALCGEPPLFNEEDEFNLPDLPEKENLQ